MATLIDWSQVATKVGHYFDARDCETRSVALAHVVIEHLLGLARDEIEEAVTDGGQDRGIDAVVIQEEAGRKAIHLFQFKCVESFDKADHNFPSSEVDKLLSFIADVLRKDPLMQQNCNPLLWARVQEVWEAFEDGTPSIVCTSPATSRPWWRRSNSA